MSVLALVTKIEEVKPVVSWAVNFALARGVGLTVLCWAHAPTVEFPLLAGEQEGEDSVLDDLVGEVRRVVGALTEDSPPEHPHLSAEAVQIRRIRHPDATAAALGRIRIDTPELVVAASPDPTGQTGATYSTNPLLRHSPANTVVLYAEPQRSCRARNVVVAPTGTAHDRTAVSLAAQLTQCGADVTIAIVEENTGDEAMEVGQRELRQIMHDAGVRQSEHIRTQVLLADEVAAAVEGMVEQSDLLLLPISRQTAVQKLLAMTSRPTIAVIKRTPPLKLWPLRGVGRDWIPRLNPGDYADLVQGLRRGSRFSVDFMVMLGLAASIASLGLLQNSPAVLIGSMLLAPLMTPMVASGLALAQANPKMANMCFKSIFWGFLLTLGISYVLGMIMPGEELAPEVIARGDPNLLDLFIALCSAAAAAYAMGRPNLVGAVAGVAIATALVPPLCSVGVSFAYRDYLNAFGAASLFATNLVSIIVAAAVTFRVMGVTASRAAPRQRRWAYRVAGGLAAIAVLLAIPLEQSLTRQIEYGRPQPMAYPLPMSAKNALVDYVDQTPGVQIILMGRPSTGKVERGYDAAVYLVSSKPLPRSFADELTAIVRREMGNDRIRVLVECMQNAWQDEPEQQPSVP